MLIEELNSHFAKQVLAVRASPYLEVHKISKQMESQELEQYQKLTKFQKDVVDALINLGFKHKYFSTYELAGWGDIKVDRFSRWSDVLKYVHEQGKDQKRFEFQRVLGLA